MKARTSESGCPPPRLGIKREQSALFPSRLHALLNVVQSKVNRSMERGERKPPMKKALCSEPQTMASAAARGGGHFNLTPGALAQ